LLQLGAASSPKHIQFPDTRLYRYEGGLTNRGAVHAFGDFDSDRYTDAILVDANNTVRVFLWSITELKFEEAAWAAVAKNATVVSVIASDFDRDGKLDLLICTRVSASLQQMSVHLQRDHSMLEVKLDGFTTGHVQMLDVDSNLHVDLVGNALGPTGDSVPSVWLNCFDSPPCSFRLQADTTLGSNYTLSAGMGFVDLDGDCLADRFMAVQRNGVENFEVWINQNRGQWSQYLSFPAPLGSGAPSFADVDKDGTMDILIPVCYPANSCSTTNSIHIIYNRQIPLCASSLEIGSQSTCRAHSNMCLGDPNFRLGDINGASSVAHVVVDRSAFAGLTFAPGEADLQLTVRAGDINMDGYPDLLVPLQRVGDDGITRYMTMWLNVPCDSARCTAQAVAAGRRTYQRVQDIDPTYSVLSSIEHAYSGGFFDFNEQGAVGLMINSNATGANSVLTLFNNLEADSLFLKAIGMNGVCPAWWYASHAIRILLLGFHLH
jgi:integrin alpha FG-GAP repeat containing protein 1